MNHFTELSTVYYCHYHGISFGFFPSDEHETKTSMHLFLVLIVSGFSINSSFSRSVPSSFPPSKNHFSSSSTSGRNLSESKCSSIRLLRVLFYQLEPPIAFRPLITFLFFKRIVKLTSTANL